MTRCESINTKSMIREQNRLNAHEAKEHACHRLRTDAKQTQKPSRGTTLLVVGWLAMAIAGFAMGGENSKTVEGNAQTPALRTHGNDARESPPMGGDSLPVPAARIIHRFDFDERSQGNLEDLPRYWLPFELPAGEFPKFAKGRFDEQMGRAAPPSFYVSSGGRNAAFHYAGPETPISSQREYHVSGYLRPDHLEHARACVSAFFVDAKGRPMLEVTTATRFFGGPEDADRWVHFDLHLPAAPEGAATVGLSLWVLQSSHWNPVEPGSRTIVHVDVAAGAWLDDIVVVAVPHIDIFTSAAGNVLSPEGPQFLLPTIAGDDLEGLSGRLTIRDVHGDTVETRTIDSVLQVDQAPKVAVDHLSPGVYSAELAVASAQGLTTSRSVGFVRVAPRLRRASITSRTFGLTLDPIARAATADEQALIFQQGVGSVKYPMSASMAQSRSDLDDDRANGRLLQNLVNRGITVTAVFADESRVGGSRASTSLGFARSANKVSTMYDEWPTRRVTDVAARFATLFSGWQWGLDEGAAFRSTGRIADSTRRLREEVTRFVTAPILVAALDGALPVSEARLPADHLTLDLESNAVNDSLAASIAELRSTGYAAVSAFVQPLAEDDFHRMPRLADFAQRLLKAHHAGADVVYVPQTWAVENTPRGRRAAPKEEYLLLRTITETLYGTRPGPRAALADELVGLCFVDGDYYTLALWDREAPPQGRVHTLQLGSNARSIDLWGRVGLLERDELGQSRIRLSQTPVLIGGVERPAIDLRASVSLEPNYVDSGLSVVNHRMLITNPGDTELSGTVELEAPRDWEMQSKRFTFVLRGREKTEIDLPIRYPPGESAGAKTLLAKMKLQNPDIYLELPLAVEIGLRNLEVHGTALVVGNDLLLRQVITNRSDQPVYLRSSAQVAGWESQHRPLNDLAPDQTQSVEYRFSAAGANRGTKVRLSLRPINEPHRTHHIDLSVP